MSAYGKILPIEYDAKTGEVLLITEPTPTVCTCSNCNHVEPKEMRCQRFPPQYCHRSYSPDTWEQPKVSPGGYCSEWQEMQGE